MSQPLPPIYRDCRRLLVHTEALVQRFSRYHKYTVGTDLRQQAMALMRGVHLAVYDRPNQPHHVQALVWLADDYKLTLQLAIEVGLSSTPRAGNSKGNGVRSCNHASGKSAWEIALERGQVLQSRIRKIGKGKRRQTMVFLCREKAQARISSSPPVAEPVRCEGGFIEEMSL